MHHVGNQQRHRPSDAGQWIFTGDVQDHNRFDGDCAWCEKQDLRLTFEVRQAKADRARHVCQACIERVPLRMEHESRALGVQQWRDYLSELAVRLMHRTCRDVLRNLLTHIDDPALQEVAVYFDRNVQLSPGRAATLLLALSRSQLEVDPRIFEVQIRSAAHKQEFACLSEREKLAVWPVFSVTIQKRLISLDLAPTAIRSRPYMPETPQKRAWERSGFAGPPG